MTKEIIRPSTNYAKSYPLDNINDNNKELIRPHTNYSNSPNIVDNFKYDFSLTEPLHDQIFDNKNKNKNKVDKL